MKIGIIAGSLEKARWFLRANNFDPKDFWYISRPQDLLGWHQTEILLGPDHWENPAWEHARLLFGRFFKGVTIYDILDRFGPREEVIYAD